MTRQYLHILGKPPDLFYNEDRVCTKDEREIFGKFIDEQEEKSVAIEGEKVSKKPRKKEKESSKVMREVCKDCGLCKDKCHNNLYGAFCRDAVIAYHYETLPGRTDDLTAKRIYINHYNIVSKFEDHKGTRVFSKDLWRFPPVCMKRESYDHILHLLAWVRNKKYVRRGEHIPVEFKFY